MNSFLKILLLCSFISLSIIPTLRAIHMFQQNRYEIYRYFSWMKKVLLQNCKMLLAIGLLLLGCIVYFIHNDILNVVVNLIIIILADIYLFKDENKRHKKYIKPLNFTARVNRQILVMIFLNLLLVIGLYQLDIESLKYLAFMYYILPWLLIYLMAILTRPIEDAVKKYYINLAKKILYSMPCKVIGITGSFGKTSSKNILNEILSEKYYTLMTPASFNTPMGITITIRNYLKALHEVFICEMGADHVGEITFLAKFVKPQIGIVTSIGPQHLNTFKSMENIINEKMALIENLANDGIGILNYDNDHIRNYKVKNTCNIITYGIKSNDVDLKALNIIYTPKGSNFDVLYKDNIYHFETKLLGEHNIANILAAIAVGIVMDISFEQLQHAVKKVNYVEHRLELKKINGYTFIDNAFNSNPVGSKMSLDVLAMMPNRRVIVTPGMIDLGIKQDELNKEFGKYMLNKADLVLLVGVNQTKAIYAGLKESGFDMNNVIVLNNVKEAFDYVYQNLEKCDTILLENDLPDAFNN